MLNCQISLKFLSLVNIAAIFSIFIAHTWFSMVNITVLLPFSLVWVVSLFLRYMNWAVPRIWREPSGHTKDCYFCFVKPNKGRAGRNAIKRVVSSRTLETTLTIWKISRFFTFRTGEFRKASSAISSNTDNCNIMTNMENFGPHMINLVDLKNFEI